MLDAPSTAKTLDDLTVGIPGAGRRTLLAALSANLRLPAETVKMAVTIITIGPILFLYPFIQRYFVQGIMTGAVKE